MNFMRRKISQIFFVSLWSVLVCAQAYGVDGAVLNIEKLLRAHKQEDAKRQIAQYIANHENAVGYMQIGSLYARLRQWPDAVHYLDIATTRDQKNALAWYELGIAQHQNSQIDEAVASFRKSLGISSTTLKTIFALGEVLELSDDRYDARYVYSTALSKLKNRADLRAKVCSLYFQDAFYKQAIIDCGKAIKQNPKDMVSQGLLAQSYYELQERKKAMDILRAALKKNPDAAFLYRVRGLIYFREKSYELAIYDLGKAFGLNGQDDESAIALARSYYESARFVDAKPLYLEACRLNPAYRAEFLAKQRDLTNKHRDSLADEYQADLDKVYPRED